jgi:hypothetical protein
LELTTSMIQCVDRHDGVALSARVLRRIPHGSTTPGLSQTYERRSEEEDRIELGRVLTRECRTKLTADQGRVVV